MVGPFGVGFLARDVEHCIIPISISLVVEKPTAAQLLTEVSRERKHLLPDQHVHGVNGRVAENLVVVNLVVALVGDPEVFPGLGDVHFVALHRGVVGVVAVVRDLPAEVRCPEGGVGDLRGRGRVSG